MERVKEKLGSDSKHALDGTASKQKYKEHAWEPAFLKILNPYVHMKSWKVQSQCMYSCL